MYHTVLSYEGVDRNNVTGNRYTAQLLWTRKWTGDSIKCKHFIWSMGNYQRPVKNFPPCNYFVRPLTNAVLPFAEIRFHVVQ